MAPGRTFLRALAGRVNSFMVTPGGARYFHIELSSRYRWYVAPTRLVLVALSGIVGVAILWSVTQTMMIYARPARHASTPRSCSHSKIISSLPRPNRKALISPGLHCSSYRLKSV